MFTFSVVSCCHKQIDTNNNYYYQPLICHPILSWIQIYNPGLMLVAGRRGVGGRSGARVSATRSRYDTTYFIIMFSTPPALVTLAFLSATAKYHSIGLSARVQNLTTGPCGAIVVINCSCADHEGVRKKLPAGPACLNGLPMAESYRMVLGYC